MPERAWREWEMELDALSDDAGGEPAEGSTT
jgi:hypothetical protein